MITSKEDLIKRHNEVKRLGFQKWLNSPMTKALMSMIPSTENSEIFKALLQACYEEGCDYGAAANSAIFLEALLKIPNDKTVK